MERTARTPGPDHPITIAPARARVRVRHGGDVVADSVDALVLREAEYPPVYYLPRAGVRMERLERSEHRTWCPYKGEASYYGIRSGDGLEADAVWTYEDPHEAVRGIKERLAFYEGKVEAIEVEFF